MDKIYISDDDSDTELELEPNLGEELDFDQTSMRSEEHTWEEDFERELPELEPEFDDFEPLSDEDVDLMEMDLDYETQFGNKS